MNKLSVWSRQKPLCRLSPNRRRLSLRTWSIPPSASAATASNSSEVSQPTSRKTEASNLSPPAVVEAASAPLLLLGYEDFYVSKDGISRTLYQLNSTSGIHGSTPASGTGGWTVEEIHDLIHAEKTYVIREAAASITENDKKIYNSPPLACIRIQEVAHGIEQGVGTGATTWEASVVAALAFRDLSFHGDILELGSGTGVGGILMLLNLIRQHDFGSRHAVRSWTCSDYESHVLRQCQQNVQSFLDDYYRESSSRQQAHAPIPSIRVTKLDWYSFNPWHCNRYNTVIACDCAYRHEDVPVLGQTLYRVLNRNDPHARIHLLGPENRAVLHQLIAYLRDDLGLRVASHVVPVDRRRLRPSATHSASQWKHASLDECDVPHPSVGLYLHVTAAHSTSSGFNTHQLSEID